MTIVAKGLTKTFGEFTALDKVDLDVAITGLSCPHGTETSMPYAQARKRYQDYKRALDDKVFFDLNGMRPKPP